MAEMFLEKIQDFHDVIRLLEEHPDWQVELRRVLFTKDLVLSQILDEGEKNYHSLLSMQPRHRTALRAFVTNILGSSAALYESQA